MDAGKTVLAVCLLCLTAGAANAASIETSYDMRRFLSEPHPFARTGDGRRPADQPSSSRRQAAPSRTAATPRPATMPPRRDVKETAVAGTGRNGGYTTDAAAVPNRHEGKPYLGILHEISLGVLAHDQGPFSSHKEETSADIHIEVRFASPDFLDVIWSPYPHIGANINTVGDTSQAFFGLSWEWEWDAGPFVGFSLGGAVHDGETDSAPLDRKELGCVLLFRESINAGYRFDDHNGIALLFDHISNARLCDENEGLESVGLRYQHRF